PTFDWLQGSSRDKHRRILLRGGMILSMDPAVGDFAKGDVLIEGKTIKAVQPNIGGVANALVVDASNTIVMPGFVDTHDHVFETNIRGYYADAAYFTSALYTDYRATFTGVFSKYNLEDAYLGMYVGALRNIDCGVTTVCDTSQISISPDHTDAC